MAQPQRDRGIAAKVPEAEWSALCAEFADNMQRIDPDQCVLACLAKINGLLIRHFPADEDNPQELSDEPIIL